MRSTIPSEVRFFRRRVGAFYLVAPLDPSEPVTQLPRRCGRGVYHFAPLANGRWAYWFVF